MQSGCQEELAAIAEKAGRDPEGVPFGHKLDLIKTGAQSAAADGDLTLPVVARMEAFEGGS